jgi:hypothetical protein
VRIGPIPVPFPAPLTAINADEDGYTLLFGEDDHLTDAEFLVVAPEDVRRLANWC